MATASTKGGPQQIATVFSQDPTNAFGLQRKSDAFKAYVRASLLLQDPAAWEAALARAVRRVQYVQAVRDWVWPLVPPVAWMAVGVVVAKVVVVPVWLMSRGGQAKASTAA